MNRSFYSPPFAALCLMLLPAIAAAQIATLYWTGNEDRWGTSPHHSFSLSPGGTDYFDRVRGYETFNMVYDRTAMVGENTSVLMNRLGVTMQTVVITGIGSGPDSGFLFQLISNEASNYDYKLGPAITVNSGSHTWRNQAGTELPEFSPISLTADAVWTIAAEAEMLWTIPLAGPFSLTKEGDGILILGSNHAYTGDTIVNAGTFGVSAIHASLAGNVHFAAGTRFAFSTDAHLAANGAITFADFGVDSVADLDASLLPGMYLLMRGNIDFTHVRNSGAANAVSIGGEATAYLSNVDGDLYIVIERPWGHFPIENEELDVDSGRFLGWVNVSSGDWVYAYSRENWVFLPETNVQRGGSWIFFPDLDWAAD